MPVDLFKKLSRTDKSDLENEINDADKEIPAISGLVKKTDYNVKINDIEDKITLTINVLLRLIMTNIRVIMLNAKIKKINQLINLQFLK